ncbi:bifunctional UDP-N-acetylglucosamine diphosphorylase/glucosamine-1-phosphate N-acetyltransferase GlmU [Vagococcus coleopterorum]|uniref:Bifunctional protein GlmU n=1 Tax=Vagococcus coleopterorum TaxID=2714946 RepID=A0A6G8ALQ8_9ENTE|nr:bifunctional UDP-N-acetylglucosamine diphosphorylase/glucosamine-1-phosphate N-acetyltransferase GlmU [Vagococcus coleopterorum]QIL45910.1 bifunctional UDP-N-acetylglucosamine diphosphorylase/glucosamine-1-phosphate N-acetyltransferase GlmU [Vagococcus coleopterorum]
MTKRFAIILAAGQGSRMKSKKYKVLHEIAGYSMVEHVIGNVEKLNPEKIVSVVGFGAESVKEKLGDRCEYALQSEQLGTGHAVLMTKELLASEEGTTLVVCGDTPLITADTLDALFTEHESSKAKATILTAHAENPFSYGRIIRNANGHVERIVEEKDANESERLVQEINTGTFCFDNKALFDALEQVGNDNAQGEYYLPDVIGILQQQGEIISAYQMAEFADSIGINDRIALSVATKTMRQRINREHMVNGVTFVDADSTYIDAGVVIGNDTVVEAGAVIKGNTVIGSNCFIGAHSQIVDSKLGDGITVTSSHIEGAVIGNGSDVGPFGRLRPGAVLAENVHIGNFVEVKNAQIANGSKVGHLTYIGDADLGKNVNVGCGTVFVNYDGKAKHQSVIGDNVFLGCHTSIVSPVNVGDGAFTAAGSTITKDVPADSLAIARSEQVNKEGYAKKLPYSN